MAVVTKYGNGYQDPAGLEAVEGQFAEGRARVITSLISVASGDSAASLHYLGKVPSSAIILSQSSIYHGAITTLDDYDVGLYKDGAAASLDLLANGLDLSSAGTKAMNAAVATGNLGKRLWELLGLTLDPGVWYDVVGTMNAASTAAESLVAQLWWAKR